MAMAIANRDSRCGSLTPPSPIIEGGQETSYIYVRNLGAGAFAEANLYMKTEDNSLVVWKEINMARLGEKEKRDAENEIDILLLLNHANIITYYNHFMDGDTLLIELEYANGGTLASKISNKSEPFEEDVVKWYLFQLASALKHCHEHEIIHRDVKSLNIFMTKTDLLKLGDFGISKILESESQLAQTIAGTPLYMSPELMKGEKYGYKSDIWALGCVVYELLTLTRTFQGTNQLRLAYEVVCGEHGTVDMHYSPQMRDMIDNLLQKDPKDRPTAEEILQSDVLESREILERKVYELNTAVRNARLQSHMSLVEQTTVPVVKSKVTEVYQWGGGKLTPHKQDIFVKGRSAVRVSAGHSHFAVVTMEKELYTWANVQGGSKIVGQLGHGNTAAYKTPKKVEALEGIGIIQAECGEDYTVCLSDDGQVYSFGSNFYGCLGCDGEEADEVSSPVRLDFFSCRPVQEVSCGNSHVAALDKDGHVYTWGCGEFGRLGLGSEDDAFSPQETKTPKKHQIKHVYAGADGTFLLTMTGRVLACGSNEYNKLGFNSEMSGLKKHKAQVYDIPCKLTFALVRPLMRLHVTSIAAGATHSAVIDICGHLFTFGCNKFGQLGLGDFRCHMSVQRVQGAMASHRVERVTCGDGFTLASTDDNYVYAWGNGEDGRLGSISADQLDLGKGPNGKSWSIPRPILGALHIVPHLSAAHWHTIIIAEKVLNQKTLKTRMSMPKRSANIAQSWKPVKKTGFQETPAEVNVSVVKELSPETVEDDSAFSNDHLDCHDETANDLMAISLLSVDSGKPRSPPVSASVELSPSHLSQRTGTSEHEHTETTLPPWLVEDLEGEVIPIPEDFVIRSPIVPEPGAMVPEGGFQWEMHSASPVPGPDHGSTPAAGLTAARQRCHSHTPAVTKGEGSQSTSVIIETLKQRIAELELANKKLKENQEHAVSVLERKIEVLEKEKKDLLEAPRQQQESLHT